MNGARIDNVTSLSEEKYTALAEQNGWSLAFSEGVVTGQVERRRGNSPTSYLVVGADDYAQGFRAGYFDRQKSVMGADSRATANLVQRSMAR